MSGHKTAPPGGLRACALSGVRARARGSVHMRSIIWQCNESTFEPSELFAARANFIHQALELAGWSLLKSYPVAAPVNECNGSFITELCIVRHGLASLGWVILERVVDVDRSLCVVSRRYHLYRVSTIITTDCHDNNCSNSFFGVTMMQSWTYFSNCNDKWHLRLFVRVYSSASGKKLTWSRLRSWCEWSSCSGHRRETFCCSALDFATTCLNSIVLRHYSVFHILTSLSSFFLIGKQITNFGTPLYLISTVSFVLT